MGYFFKIDFDFQTNTFNSGIIACDHSDKLKWYYEHINTDVVDIVSITDSVDIIVDDEGLLKSGSPVYEITRNDNPTQPMTLAGILLFGKNKFTDDCIEVIGFDTELELVTFVNSINIKVIGMAK